MTNNMSKVKNMDATRMGNYGSTERSHIFVSNKNYGLSWKGNGIGPLESTSSQKHFHIFKLCKKGDGASFKRSSNVVPFLW